MLSCRHFLKHCDEVRRKKFPFDDAAIGAVESVDEIAQVRLPPIDVQR